MRQLLAVRRYGSFAKAAQTLAISQPTLSASIARLEDQLGVRLFDRTAAGSHLTPIGELIADRAGKVIAEVEEIVRDAGLLAGGEAGVVRLGLGAALRQAFIPRFVVMLAQTYPALGLKIEVLDGDRLLPMLRSRDLDLVISAVGSDVVEEDLVATEVLTTHVVAVAHPDHPLVGERNISAERFADFPAAGTSRKQFTTTKVIGAREGQETLSHYQSNDYDVLLQLAVGGHATLVAPMFVVEADLQAGRLKRIDLDWNYRVTFAAIATRAASYSPIISRIVRHASLLGAQLSDEARGGAGR